MTVLVLGATGNVGGAVAGGAEGVSGAVLMSGYAAETRVLEELDPEADDVARAQITEAMGADHADAAIEIFRRRPEGESPVVPTVGQLLGRPPGPLAGWVRRHRDELTGPA